MTLAAELGPIFERKLLDVHLTIVTGGALAEECNNEENWARALAGPTKKFRDIAGSGLFTARTSDPLWSQARRILDPGFTQAALRNYHNSMASVADDLAEDWKRRNTIDMYAAMTNATLEVIARAGFSRNFTNALGCRRGRSSFQLCAVAQLQYLLTHRHDRRGQPISVVLSDQQADVVRQCQTTG
jgi:cytochrome P450